mmetsp:Transcript_110476/g.330489  ORF Transcript_110476/g.330489 Transcript_110476/m.330489 type:complete len:548 (+) Transcript_110476:290-1933(+)
MAHDGLEAEAAEEEIHLLGTELQWLHAPREGLGADALAPLLLPRPHAPGRPSELGLRPGREARQHKVGDLVPVPQGDPAAPVPVQGAVQPVHVPERRDLVRAVDPELRVAQLHVGVPVQGLAPCSERVPKVLAAKDAPELLEGIEVRLLPKVRREGPTLERGQLISGECPQAATAVPSAQQLEEHHLGAFEVLGNFLPLAGLLELLQGERSATVRVVGLKGSGEAAVPQLRPALEQGQVQRALRGEVVEGEDAGVVAVQDGPQLLHVPLEAESQEPLQELSLTYAHVVVVVQLPPDADEVAMLRPAPVREVAELRGRGYVRHRGAPHLEPLAGPPLPWTRGWRRLRVACRHGSLGRPLGVARHPQTQAVWNGGGGSFLYTAGVRGDGRLQGSRSPPAGSAPGAQGGRGVGETAVQPVMDQAGVVVVVDPRLVHWHVGVGTLAYPQLGKAIKVRPHAGGQAAVAPREDHVVTGTPLRHSAGRLWRSIRPGEGPLPGGGNGTLGPLARARGLRPRPRPRQRREHRGRQDMNSPHPWGCLICAESWSKMA